MKKGELTRPDLGPRGGLSPECGGAGMGVLSSAQLLGALPDRTNACREREQRPLRGQFLRGSSLTELFCMGRRPCPQCIAKLSPALQQHLRENMECTLVALGRDSRSSSVSGSRGGWFLAFASSSSSGSFQACSDAVSVGPRDFAVWTTLRVPRKR